MDYTQSELKDFLLKEIELIQDVIKRMSQNSFTIKGWTLTLVVGTMILKGSELQIIVAYLPLIVFWWLDAYFLRQERLYRKLYDWVIQHRMTSNEHVLSLNAYRFNQQVASVDEIMLSTTFLPFYGSIFIILTVYSLLLIMFNINF